MLIFDIALRTGEGERFTLTTYTPRGGEHLNQVQKDTLRTLGFPIARRRFG